MKLLRDIISIIITSVIVCVMAFVIALITTKALEISFWLASSILFNILLVYVYLKVSKEDNNNEELKSIRLRLAHHFKVSSEDVGLLPVHVIVEMILNENQELKKEIVEYKGRD